MKKIGIIGGMSYESTTQYYKRLNRQINERTGGFVSADLVLRSVNFEKYHKLMEKGRWDRIGELLAAEAWELAYHSNCDYVALATNTMHKVAKEIIEQVQGNKHSHTPRLDGVYPRFIHIGDCIADECKAKGCRRVALLGTKFTMTEDFMKRHLQKNGLEVVDTFKKLEIDEIDRIIFEELCHGIVDPKSQECFLDIILRADSRDMRNGGTGFDGVILGCTELEMLLRNIPEYLIVNLKHQHHFEFVDSTQVHIDSLVELSLS